MFVALGYTNVLLWTCDTQSDNALQHVIYPRVGLVGPGPYQLLIMPYHSSPDKAMTQLVGKKSYVASYLASLSLGNLIHSVREANV